jgi:hypothetical protein
MRYFLDTEFIETEDSLDLLSIALVREDGESIYYECNECDHAMANSWVTENVLPNLSGNAISKKSIAIKVLEFLDGDTNPLFWGYYADYDWVLFCNLFGTMADLPKKFPMFCLDIKQVCVMLGNPSLPIQGSKEHHALNDALWNMNAYNYLLDIGQKLAAETPCGNG